MWKSALGSGAGAAFSCPAGGGGGFEAVSSTCKHTDPWLWTTLGCGQGNETSEIKLDPAAVLLGSIAAFGAGHNNHADVLLGR